MVMTELRQLKTAETGRQAGRQAGPISLKIIKNAVKTTKIDQKITKIH